MKEKCILFMLVLIICCCDSQDKENQVEVSSGGKLLPEYKVQKQLQKKFDSLRVELRDKNQGFENTRVKYEKDIQNQKNTIGNNHAQIMIEKRKIKAFENSLIEKKKEYNLIYKQISKEVWIKERDSKLSDLDIKRQSFSRLLKEIKGINIEEPDDRQLRILDRSIKYYQKEFERINEPIPDLLTSDRKRLKSEFERTGLALQKIVSNLDIQKNIIINETPQKERKLKEELSLLEREIEEYKNKIEQSQKHIKTLNNEINEAGSKMSELDSSFKANSTDIINNIKDLQYKVTDTFGRLVRLRYSELGIYSPELKEVYNNLLQLEDRIINLYNEDNRNAAQVLIESIDVQWWNFANLTMQTGRDYTVFKNLYTGEPFLIHFELADSQTYSLKDEVKNYREVFKDQMKILKDYLDYYPASTIYIEGHTDRIEYSNNIYLNVHLSQRRAYNIKKMIMEHHVLKPETDFIVDWYSKYLNRPIFDPTLVEYDSGGVHDRRVEMRIFRPYQNEKIPEVIRKYKMFRDSLRIQINDTTKYFHHERGFWEELNYDTYYNAPTIQVYYQGEAYKALLKNNIFETLTARRDSLGIHPDCRIKDIRSFEFGSQFRTVLFIDGNPFRIEICRTGAKRIEDIGNQTFRDYLMKNLVD